jgi:hypothetical protein
MRTGNVKLSRPDAFNGPSMLCIMAAVRKGRADIVAGRAKTHKEVGQLLENWAGLEGPFKAPGETTGETALALAIERDGQVEKGEVQPISHKEMMARLRR